MERLKGMTLLFKSKDALEANLVRAKLNEEGIDSEVLDANTTSILQLSEFTYDIYVPNHVLTKSRKVLKSIQIRNDDLDNKQGFDMIKVVFILLIVIILGIAIATGMEYY